MFWKKLAALTYKTDSVVQPRDVWTKLQRFTLQKTRRPHLNVYCQENLKFHINGEINFHFTEQEIFRMVYIAG